MGGGKDKDTEGEEVYFVVHHIILHHLQIKSFSHKNKP